MMKGMLSVILIAAFTVSGAYAAVGDEVATVSFPEGAMTGVGVAFDGEFLYYSYAYDSNLYRMRPDGSGHAVIPTTATTSLGALSYDAGRDMIWAGGTSCLPGSANLPIWLIDKDTGAASLEFSISLPLSEGDYVYCFNDGLAYDASDDSLWFSDDVSPTMGHFASDGTPLGTVDLTAIHPDFAHNSGIAIGGQNFYLGTDGYETTMRIDKDTLDILDTFVNADYRIEDMECDPVTYYPVEVMWIRDAYAGTTKAYEIERLTCGLGGEDPEDPGENDVPEFGFFGAALVTLGLAGIVLARRK